MKSSVGADIEGKSNEYQDRYLAHQVHPGGKRDELIAIIKERHSNRRFDDKGVDDQTLSIILDTCRHAPSSCDRFGVRIKIEKDRDRKTLLNGLLVGATGWLYRAPVVLMLWADGAAYQGGDNGDEVEYNARLDAGVMAQTIMLSATSLGLHTAFVNPQVRKENREFFEERFKPQLDEPIFCGAVAIGYPHPDPIDKTRRLIDTVEIL